MIGNRIPLLLIVWALVVSNGKLLMADLNSHQPTSAKSSISQGALRSDCEALLVDASWLFSGLEQPRLMVGIAHWEPMT
jgi:hypothetical protein